MMCQIISIQIRNAWEISQPARKVGENSAKLKLKELDNCQVPAAASAQNSNTLIFCVSLVLHLQLHPKHPHPTPVTSPTVLTTRNTAECRLLKCPIAAQKQIEKNHIFLTIAEEIQHREIR